MAVVLQVNNILIIALFIAFMWAKLFKRRLAEIQG